MIQAVIIDDEEISLQALGEKIEKYCPGITILKLFSRPAEALKEIRELNPDLVFLDIDMPKMNGFTFLKKCSPVTFEVIFTTACSQYAIEALRISALDFLLKPIDIRELIAAVDRLTEKRRNRAFPDSHFEEQVQMYLRYQQSSGQLQKIALPVLNGLQFVEITDIISLNHITRYIRGEGGILTLSDGSEVEVSRRIRNDFLARISK